MEFAMLIKEKQHAIDQTYEGQINNNNNNITIMIFQRKCNNYYENNT